MKISLGMNLQSGPWGGGNQFGRDLTCYLQERGVSVSFDLKTPDLDIILLAEPNTRLKISSYGHRDILKYLVQRNRHCLVVHRLNNSSEARDDAAKGFNKYRIVANKVADHTVFISRWLYARYVETGFTSPNYSIILNGGQRPSWEQEPAKKRPDKLRLVTHHWSTNPNKGFDIYKQVDEMLNSSTWSQRIEFTYIGRLPDGFAFENAIYIEPQSGSALITELQKHHVYLTASQHEAAGMHHIEGALCGLPLLYRDSGGIPEYCRGFGISFVAENFRQKLQEMIDTYEHWQTQIKHYPHTAERMGQDYYDLFLNLLERRDEIVKQRRWWRKPHQLARIFFLK